MHTGFSTALLIAVCISSAAANAADMVTIAAGTLQMGRNDGADDEREADKVAHGGEVARHAVFEVLRGECLGFPAEGITAGQRPAEHPPLVEREQRGEKRVGDREQKDRSRAHGAIAKMGEVVVQHRGPDGQREQHIHRAYHDGEAQ